MQNLSHQQSLCSNFSDALMDLFLGVRCSATPHVNCLADQGWPRHGGKHSPAPCSKIRICSLGEDPGKKSGNPGSGVGCRQVISLKKTRKRRVPGWPWSLESSYHLSSAPKHVKKLWFGKSLFCTLFHFEIAFHCTHLSWWFSARPWTRDLLSDSFSHQEVSIAVSFGIEAW